ncbi:HORMA domain-containing protein 1 isoform X2 [Hemibagrus wyckioides]|nr:HORMA domain-containing protein 1 isoform X2 [Hemibagrus wyckioides]XP_058267730.1 HORMA domain-containing protein 1 isoform X2 [Hemibagrus wyckioides]XP_058267819.1 HORMA domain-containing protein 1 isoform X2 [Hemibagrus wyckioides]
MACEQRLRTHQESQMLPHAVATEQQSLVVVKKLLAIAVSSITYLRGLFPEKAYGSKYVEEQKVMILREERTCPGASQIVQWLQGCFDAIQKRYLRMILLSMYSDPEYPEKVTECYQFRIQYTEKGPRLDFESKNQKNMTKMDCSDIKKSSILLVRKLYMLMQNLGPLPDSVCLNMKLFYYDDVTPHDYQPPGFKEGENSSLVFQKEPVNLTMGEVVTPFHTLKVDVTTERERLEQVDNEEPVCARDRWKINEDEMVCVSKVQHEIVSKENVVIDTGIENSDLSKEEMLENSQFMADSLVKKTTDLSVAARRTRSGRVFNYSDKKDGTVSRATEKKPVSQFQFPLSQDLLPAAPKRRKFSVPKENH